VRILSLLFTEKTIFKVNVLENTNVHLWATGWGVICTFVQQYDLPGNLTDLELMNEFILQNIYKYDAQVMTLGSLTEIMKCQRNIQIALWA
jgi:hypothetical protein